MYKIFIDTNIFLDFYRFNNREKLSNLQSEMGKYQKHFISTEQSQDEFMRNRERTINDFIKTLKEQINPLYDSNFLVGMTGYERYLKSIKSANKEIDKMMHLCQSLLDDTSKDLVYNLYSSFNKEVYRRTDDIINRAIRRKYIGNPPTSNKTTCGDEIIWETLLEYCQSDCIFVTRDQTFIDNANFLKMEYANKCGKKMTFVTSISEAIRILGAEPSSNLESLENMIIIEKTDIDLKRNIIWFQIIYRALEELGGKSSLEDLYTKIEDMLGKEVLYKHFDHMRFHARVRGSLERFCSSSPAYINQLDLFEKIDDDCWAIKTK